MSNIVNLDGVTLDDEEIKNRQRCPGTIDLSRANFDVVVDTGPVSTTESSIIDDLEDMKRRANLILVERGLPLRFSLQSFLTDGEVMRQLELLTIRRKPDK